MEKTTLYLERETRSRLRDAARRSGRPQAELLREAITRYLDSDAAPVPRSIGLGVDPEVTGANSEDWLRGHWRPR
jgi:hypothetical protein